MGYYYPYYPTTTAPSSSSLCTNTCRTVIGCIAAFFGCAALGVSIVFCCRRMHAQRQQQQQLNSGVVHITNDNQNNPIQSYTPMVNPYPPNPAPWQPPPPPPPQPVYGVPLAQPTDPNQGVTPPGYASPSYPPATGGYGYGAPPPPPAQYVGYTDGSGAAPAYAGAGNVYYSRSADAAEARDAVRAMPDVTCGTGKSQKK